MEETCNCSITDNGYTTFQPNTTVGVVGSVSNAPCPACGFCPCCGRRYPSPPNWWYPYTPYTPWHVWPHTLYPWYPGCSPIWCGTGTNITNPGVNINSVTC